MCSLHTTCNLDTKIEALESNWIVTIFECILAININKSLRKRNSIELTIFPYITIGIESMQTGNLLWFCYCCIILITISINFTLIQCNNRFIAPRAWIPLLELRNICSQTHQIGYVLGLNCVVMKNVRMLVLRNPSDGKMIHLKYEKKRNGKICRKKCSECQAPCSESKLNNVCDVFSRENKPFWIISSFSIQRMLEMSLLMPFHTKTCRRAGYQRQCIKNSTSLLRCDFDG